MKALVTGGAGFIGSNLVERLVGAGHEVLVVDNLHTGAFENVKGFIRASQFQHLDCKRLSKLSAGRSTKKEKFRPDVIFHLGMYSSSPMYIKQKKLVGEVLEGATAVFDYALGCGARVVFASSSSLYNGWAPPHQETMVPKVMDFYTEGRYGVERLAQLYRDLYGLSYAGMRFFSVYGPREESKGRYANLVTQFMWAAQKGRPIIMRGDGSPRRDFVHVSDVVEALLLAAASDKCDIFNVGTGVSRSLNEAANLVKEGLGNKVEIIHLPEKGQDPRAPGMPEIGKNYVRETLADVSKSERELGFKSKVTLPEGVRILLEKKDKRS